MKHTITQENGATIVAFEGDIDLESSPKSREILLKAVDDAGHVLVDLSEVSYIDSSGVATLVESLQAARSKSGRFALLKPSDPVRRVLELARLDQVFTLHTSLDAALA